MTNKAPFEILISRDARRDRRKVGNPQILRRIDERLQQVAAAPFAEYNALTTIKGEKDAFRLRVGDWRAIYKIDRKARTMLVVAIKPRGGAY